MTETRTITIPIQIKLEIEGGRVAPVTASTESLAIESSNTSTSLEGLEKAQARFDAPFDADYSGRGGYQDDFLGEDESLRVWLPEPDQALALNLARLIGDEQDYVLRYHNYSLAMHAKRRVAVYSAANVDFSQRYEMSRPADVWRFDPRIAQEAQLGNWYYARNNFDRGHLTRREDLEFGPTPLDALQSAADTCHWTNCTPQHGRFNQNKQIWQGIERYLLEESIFTGHVRAQIITGPVLDAGDPDYRGVQYPLQFWKVVAAQTASGRLFATAYIASQQAVIAQYGIEATEAPFGAYKTFQTKIETIERLTGLSFRGGADGAPLSECDPLAKLPPRFGRRRSAAAESLAADFGVDGFEIARLDDMILP